MWHSLPPSQTRHALNPLRRLIGSLADGSAKSFDAKSKESQIVLAFQLCGAYTGIG